MLSTIEYTVTAVVCLITAVVIQRIYVKERLRGTNGKAVEGIKWFGLAIFVWGVGAFLNLLFRELFHWEASNSMLIYMGVFISLANSLFILLSLPSIEHQAERGIVVRMVQRFSTKEFVSLYAGVLGMIAFVFIATSYNNEAIGNNLVWLVDIPISALVAISLLIELNKAFTSRNMKFMYLPTVALFLLIMVAVTYRIVPKDAILNVVTPSFLAVVGSITSISFKFLFILLFSILLYSWKFLSENEQQESLIGSFTDENLKLKKQMEHLTLANESHLDTIKSIKEELNVLKEASKIELSERQKEVLGNLAYFGVAKSYPEIADAMHISLDGLQTHIHHIKQVLNIRGTGGKEQLITFAKNNNFIEFATISEAK